MARLSQTLFAVVASLAPVAAFAHHEHTLASGTAFAVAVLAVLGLTAAIRK